MIQPGLAIASLAFSAALIISLSPAAFAQSNVDPVDSDEELTEFRSEATVHGGIQVLDPLTGTDDLRAFYVELNTGLGLHNVPYLTLLADGRLESLNATAETDDRISLFAQVRPGLRIERSTINNLMLYGEVSAVRTWEWYQKNGDLYDDYPTTYTTALYNVGVADRYRGAHWRLSVAHDGYQSQAGRQPLQLRGDVHIVEEGSNTWGISARLSPDYLSLGLSLRLR